MADSDIGRIKRPVEWRPIPGFEGHYSITRDGRVWSHKRMTKFGNRQITNKSRWLKPALDKKGYHVISLWRDNRGKNFFIHGLVMAVWGPPQPSPEHEINHCDTNKLNNHVSNLEWLTHLQNIRHGLALGRRSSGEFTTARLAAASRDKLGRFTKGI